MREGCQWAESLRSLDPRPLLLKWKSRGFPSFVQKLSTAEDGCQLHTREGTLTFGAVGSGIQHSSCNELPVILGLQATAY